MDIGPFLANVLRTVKDNPNIEINALIKKCQISSKDIEKLVSDGMLIRPECNITGRTSEKHYWQKFTLSTSGDAALYAFETHQKEIEASRSAKVGVWVRWAVTAAISAASFVAGLLVGKLG